MELDVDRGLGHGAGAGLAGPTLPRGDRPDAPRRRRLAAGEEAIASQAVFLARLLAGEMPEEIEEAFAACGLSLFPAKRKDLVADCCCPDWESPCKHVAAVYYLLAERFDEDPFLILAWRGRPRERLLAELRALRGATPAGSAGRRCRAGHVVGRPPRRRHPHRRRAGSLLGIGRAGRSRGAFQPDRDPRRDPPGAPRERPGGAWPHDRGVCWCRHTRRSSPRRRPCGARRATTDRRGRVTAATRYPSVMRVPGFLARQFIVKGSLRNTETGFSVQAPEPASATARWWTSGTSRSTASTWRATAITAVRTGEDAVYRATDVSAAAPVAFRKGDRGDLPRRGPAPRARRPPAGGRPGRAERRPGLRSGSTERLAGLTAHRSDARNLAAVPGCYDGSVTAIRLRRVPPFERGLTLGDFLIPIRLGERAAIWQRNLLLIVAGALLITLGAYVSFNVPAFAIGDVYVPANPYVPFTLQTFGVLFAGALLGARRGVAVDRPVPAHRRHRHARCSRSAPRRRPSPRASRTIATRRRTATSCWAPRVATSSASWWRPRSSGGSRSWAGTAGCAARSRPWSSARVVIYAVGVPWLAAAADLSVERRAALRPVPVPAAATWSSSLRRGRAAAGRLAPRRAPGPRPLASARRRGPTRALAAEPR